MGEALITGAGGLSGDGKIYKWSRYKLNSKTMYKWEKWNAISTVTYKWNRWNTQTQYTWNKWNSIQSTSNKPTTKGVTGAGVFNYSSIRAASNAPTISDNKWTATLDLNITNATQNYSNLRGKYVPCSWNDNGEGDVITITLFNANYTTYAGIFIGINTISVRYENTGFSSTSGYYAQVSGTLYWVGPVTEWVRDSYIGTVTSTNASAYPNGSRWDTDGKWYDGRTSTLIKGTTSQGQVTSTNSTAYPSPGVSGSYWYESAGSTTSYSKGTNKLGTVESENGSLYPNGGRWATDGNWYDNRSSYIVYSMGTFKDTVYNTIRNTYPDNGMQGSYWYVYIGEMD